MAGFCSMISALLQGQGTNAIAISNYKIKKARHKIKGEMEEGKGGGEKEGKRERGREGRRESGLQEQREKPRDRNQIYSIRCVATQLRTSLRLQATERGQPPMRHGSYKYPFRIAPVSFTLP